MKIIISSVVIIAIILGGGLVYMHEKQEAFHQEMVDIVKSKEATNIFEDGILKLDSKAFTKEGIIQNYSVDYSTIEHNPMGGIDGTLYINNQKKLYVRFTLNSNNDDELDKDSGISGYSAQLDKLLEGAKSNNEGNI